MPFKDKQLRVAAVTMVWNENVFLPIWIRHYGRHLGYENLFIIDNDSDDGSTTDLRGCSRVRYPRAPFDDVARADYVSKFVNSLRSSYDAVIFTDADEFLVPEPSEFSSLVDYVAQNPGDALGAIGLNVHQVLTEELPFSEMKPVFSQRRHVQFVSPMCKPLITRRDVRYSAGFHNSSLRPTFGRLYNFHLRWIDCGYALKRLAMTRSMQWNSVGSWHYQRQSDEDTLAQFLNVRKMERRESLDFRFSDQMDRVLASLVNADSDSPVVIPQDVRDAFLTVLPERFNEAVL